MKRTVAILTKSKKRGGYCVAGIDMDTYEWIRLVTDDIETHGALCKSDIQYTDGSYCKPLDIVRVEIVKDAPLRYQPENAMIDRKKPMQKISTLSSIERIFIIHPCEKPGNIFGNTYAYITDARISSVGYSLTMVEVNDLALKRSSYGKTKADFIYRGILYQNISVTDTDYFEVEDSRISKAVLIISLPNSPNTNGDGRYYKFIAKIYPVQ